MSSHQPEFIQLAEFEPDTLDFDNPKLDLAINVTPSYGTYRPVERMQTVSKITDPNWPTGGYVHLTGSITAYMKINQTAEDPDPTKANAVVWYDRDGTDITELDDYGQTMTNGIEGNDTTWITPSTMDSITSTDNLVWLQLETPPRTPTTVGAGDITIRIRARYRDLTGTEYDTPKIFLALYEDGVGNLATTTVTPDADLVNEWEEFEWAIGAGVCTGADFTKLYLGIGPYFNSKPLTDVNTLKYPVADEYYDWGWEADDGESTDMFEHVDYCQNGFWAPPTVGVDDEYVVGPSLNKSKSSTIIFKFDEIPFPYNTPHNFWSHVTAENTNMSFKIKVIQPWVGEPPEESDSDESFWTFSDANFKVISEGTLDTLTQSYSDLSGAGEFITVADVLQADSATKEEMIEALDTEQAVYVAITATYNGGGTGTQYLNTTTSTMDKDSGDGSYENIQVTSGVNEKTYALDPGPPRADADDYSGHKIHVRCKKQTQPTYDDVRVALLVDGTHKWTKSFSITSSFKDYTFTIPDSVIKSILSNDVEYDNLSIAFRATIGATHVSEFYFEYPADAAKPYVFTLSETPGTGPVTDISWALMDAKDPNETGASDYNQIIVGTENDLYDVTKFGFAVMTAGGAGSYGDTSTLTAAPRPWSFASYGDDILATNYTDDLQYLQTGGTVFAKAASSSTYDPKGRFVAVIGGHVVLGDINPNESSYPSGKPFHLWCSHLHDYTKWDVADYDYQSAIFPLASKSGAITGLVGGEYGLVFKRNSVWRMTYVGLPPIFQFDMLIDGVGCDHPGSIVQAGGNSYFWGGGGIHSIGESGYRRISATRIEKYLFDSKYEDRALYSPYTADPLLNETAVQGAYDGYSGLVWWLYRTADTSKKFPFMRDKMLCYSILEDRFTAIDITLDPKSRLLDSIDLILGSANSMVNEEILNRGLILLASENLPPAVIDPHRIHYAKFNDDVSLPARLKTKVMSTASFGKKVGRDIEVIAVRPIYVAQPQLVASTPASRGSATPGIQPATTELPDFTITIECAQEPSMVIGYQSETVTRRRENRQGWIPVKPKTGEFWRYQIDAPGLNRSTLKEFLGLQILINERGDG